MKLTKTEKVASADSNCVFNIKSVEVEGTDLKECLTAFFILWEGKGTEVTFKGEEKK
jgi:hypothetical protein